jgi:mRNA interferase RelE/StbE
MNSNNPLYGYHIIISKKAQKSLATLDSTSQDKIINKIKTLVAQTHSLNIKKLKGYQDLYRIKIDQYRIIYESQHKIITIHVIFIGARKEIYQEFRRYFGS